MNDYYLTRRRTQPTPKREPAAQPGERSTMPKPTNEVERIFDSILHLSSDEQKELRTMLRAREWEAPPAQLPLKAVRDRSHKKKPAAPAAETSAQSA